MAKLRLVKPAVPTALAHTNRMGETYYLHEGKTKTGKLRYFFAKTVREGALATVPEGFEVSESINGVVSVRRASTSASLVPDEDVKLIEAAVARHPHLSRYQVRALGNAIVVFEPHPGNEELRGVAEYLGIGHRASAYLEKRIRKTRYAPVVKFEREGDGYLVRRMRDGGDGGWSYPLQYGKLAALARSFVPKIGTEKFFELM